jgi:hypothetical protein
MLLNPLMDSNVLESIDGFKVLESTNRFNNNLYRQNANKK